MLETILIFACDHRKIDKWNLPYIRIGSKESNAILNIKHDDEIIKFDPLLSEGALILYVYKHIEEFGNPDYVGFMHYRRFFSFAIKLPILNIPNNVFNLNLCATPFLILSLIKQHNLDGITIMPFNVVNSNEHAFVNIIDQLKYLMMTDIFNCPAYIIDEAFDIFLNNCGDLKQSIENTFSIEALHVCNIFILKNDLFKQYSNIIFNTAKQILEKIPNSMFNKMHPRFLGYILERFTSCYLYAMHNIGKKIVHLPLLTVDAHIHEKWTKPDE